MPIFAYKDTEALGTVAAVDTATATVSVENVELLRKLQVNRLVVLQSSKPGQHLVGIVHKIIRNIRLQREVDDNGDGDSDTNEFNVVKISLIGTFLDKVGTQDNVFRRTLETVPEIEAKCFAVEGEQLTQFMRAVSFLGSKGGERLSLGYYTLDEHAEAFLNANRFFQRHAVIVGSTGSGKSWTTARLLERIAELHNACAVLFDIHGEYHTLGGDGVRHFRIAGPADLAAKSMPPSVIFFPYWLLGAEDLTTLFIDRSDSNAPNQAMVLGRAIIEAKRKYLEENKRDDVLKAFTIDSPVAFSIDGVLDELNALNTKMEPGARAGTERQGEMHGKLSRMISRLEAKRNDRRLSFLFAAPPHVNEFGWLDEFARKLLAGTVDQHDGCGGVKVINFSEVPSDILPLVVGRLASLVFSIQQWTRKENRHPIALFCDEAHLYMPNRQDPGNVSAAALPYFERIAKEGRKYGVGLVVISQRPSEVSRTILSQCNNFVALRLTNAEDQQVIQRLLPDTLGGFADILPVLDTAEALVVGDASLLPSRIRIGEPQAKPDSGTISFWDRWCEKENVQDVANAVLSWRCQSAITAKPIKLPAPNKSK